MNPVPTMLLALAVPLAAAPLVVLARRRPNLRESVTLIAATLLFGLVTTLVPPVMNGVRPAVILAEPFPGLPLALSLGDASTSRIPLGIVVVGGIMFSLILTLFVIPAMYSFMSSRKKKNALEEMDEAAAAVH